MHEVIKGSSLILCKLSCFCCILTDTWRHPKSSRYDRFFNQGSLFISSSKLNFQLELSFQMHARAVSFVISLQNFGRSWWINQSIYDKLNSPVRFHSNCKNDRGKETLQAHYWQVDWWHAVSIIQSFFSTRWFTGSVTKLWRNDFFPEDHYNLESVLQKPWSDVRQHNAIEWKSCILSNDQGEKHLR